jgi:SNF2 family DNA or RNA helicase
MESEGKTYLMFDKAISTDHSYNHAFNNPITKSITVNSIFTSDYPYFEGIEAIIKFNELFDKIDTIPVDLDNKLYNVYMFYFKISGVDVKVTIISIDNVEISSYVKAKKTIPNHQFLVSTCRSHNLYNKATMGVNIYASSITDGLTKAIQDIVTNASKPNADVTDPMTEQPPFAMINMYPYQKRTVKWMVNKEKEQNIVRYGMNDEIILGEVVYDAIKQTFITTVDRKKLVFSGGALIDEVGLGKTFQTLSLSLFNQPTNNNYYQKDKRRLCSRATLIICPNQLCGQWTREIGKVIKKDYNVSIITMFTKTQHDKHTYQDLLDADFVITSYNFLANQSFLQLWTSTISSSKSWYKSSAYNHDTANTTIQILADELRNNMERLFEKTPNILLLHWHRIIIDEFHEIFANTTYAYVGNFLKLFDSTYRWAVTGTPFDKASSCLINMINFVTGYVNGNDEKILLNEHVHQYVKNNFFRRNTKKSVQGEYQLLPLQEHVVWLDFSKTEWMMYNAYAANPTIDKFGSLLRQLCCHPQIASEIKATLSNCKTLEDIEKMMVKHYEKDAKTAHDKVKYLEYRLNIAQQKKKILIWKRERRFLKEAGYFVKVILPQPQFTPDEIKKMEQLALANGDMFAQELAPNLFVDAFSDSEQESDDEKEVIIISDDTQDKIMKIIGKKMATNIPLNITDTEALIVNYTVKLAAAKKEYDGKQSTFEYFDKVMNKLKVTTQKIKGPDDESDSDSDDENNEECAICLSTITGHDLGVTKCGHIFCYNCVKPFVEKQSKCPICQKHVKSDEIYMIEQKIEKVVDKETSDKASLINKVGTKLANLIFFLKKTDKHCIIFSQWDDLLKRVGDVLDDYGIKNVFCRGHVWQRDKAIREFNGDNGIKVIMLSSESAASGTNLTKAEMVILLDPVYGSYEYRRNTEWQAIGRAYRMGQTKQVTVVRFVIKGTVEEEIYNLNKKEDAKLVVTDKITFTDKVSETTGNDIDLNEDDIKDIEASKAKADLTKKASKKPTKVVKGKTPTKVVIPDSDSDESD